VVIKQTISHTQPLTVNVLSQNENEVMSLNVGSIQSVSIYLLGNVKYF